MKNLITLIALLFVCLGSKASDFHFVVAQDGSGDFTTVQAAINAVPDYRKAGPTRILIKKGIYKEKIIVPGSKDGVQLIGEDGVVLTYDDYANKPNIFGENKGTSGSGSIYIFGSNFLAENITFENSSGPVGQAVACHVAGDRAVFRRCRFLGFQDTLYTFGADTRQYYEDCYIEGSVDFIFGKATAVFNRCEIRSKTTGGYVTAPATPEGTRYGYVFHNCQLTADEGVKDGSVWLSRPWRPYAQCVYINCQLGTHIRPEGWNNWGSPEKEKTAFYAEYNSTGPGARPDMRASWSFQISNPEHYDIARVLAGDDQWNPLSPSVKK